MTSPDWSYSSPELQEEGYAHHQTYDMFFRMDSEVSADRVYGGV